ncbi:MAG: HWE histidine kinase domain-containing protein [Pseudolabrys sp.]
MRVNEAPSSIPVQDPDFRLDFLSGGGEMGALMRAYRWERTSLGVPETWPQSLRTSVRLLLTTRQPMFIWWGPELIQFYNDAYRQTMGPERHPQALGQRGRECWDEIWDIIGPQIEFVMTGQGATWNEDQLVPVTRHGRREDVWWTYGYSPIDDETRPGGVGGVLVVCNDITAQHETTEALRANEERLELALDAGVIGAWDWHIQENRVFADERFARLYGVDPAEAAAGVPVEAFVANIHPDDRLRVERKVRKAVRSVGSLSVEYRLMQRDGSIRWVLARGYCLGDANGRALRFPGASVDITDRKEAEEHRKLLTRELSHRVKNTLATVQAIANQSLRDDVPAASARAAFSARLRALSNAQDVLTGERWAGAELDAVILAAVDAFAAGPARFRIEGIPVRLSPRSALALAMALHELCTNAAKYGALSIPDGRVEISWQIDTARDEGHLVFRWAESGGPRVKPPSRKGFGMRLIENGLAAELSSDVNLAYNPDGVVFTLRAPLKLIQQDSAAAD